MEQQETEYAVNYVRVRLRSMSGLAVYEGVDEIMYAEKFILVTHTAPDGVKIRSTFTYDELVYMDVMMKEEMPVIGEERSEVQDKVPESTDDMLKRIGLSIVEDDD